jgi:hypothetical protein
MKKPSHWSLCCLSFLPEVHSQITSQGDPVKACSKLAYCFTQN